MVTVSEGFSNLQHSKIYSNYLGKVYDACQYKNTLLLLEDNYHSCQNLNQLHR